MTTTFTFDVPAVVDLEIKKLNTIDKLPVSTFPPVSNLFLYNYGVKKWFNDSHAAIKRENYPVGADGEATYKKAVRDKMDACRAQMVAGTPPGVKQDPVAAFLATIANNPDLAQAIANNPAALAAIVARANPPAPTEAQPEPELQPHPTHVRRK